jgi:hypothetical protein
MDANDRRGLVGRCLVLSLVGATVATLATARCGSTGPTGPGGDTTTTPSPTPISCVGAPPSMTSFAANPATITYGNAFTLSWTAPCGYVALRQKDGAPFALNQATNGTYELRSGSAGYPSGPGSTTYEATNGDTAQRFYATVTVNPAGGDGGGGGGTVTPTPTPGGGTPTPPTPTPGTTTPTPASPTPTPVGCGDGVCASGEKCSCVADCNGQSCNDNKACTNSDTCRSDGTCRGNAIAPCCGNGTCESGEKCGCTADCQGQSCNDGNPCTSGETCQSSGSCGGGSNVANGTVCQNTCNVCISGTCSGHNQSLCSGTVDACKICNANGTCSCHNGDGTQCGGGPSGPYYCHGCSTCN